MHKSYTVRGTYGGSYTPCSVFVVETRYGYWYAVEDSRNVNFTHVELENGVDVETLPDSDYFYASEPINSEDQLLTEIEDRED